MAAATPSKGRSLAIRSKRNPAAIMEAVDDEATRDLSLM